MSDFITFINSLCYWDQKRFWNIYNAFLELERAPNIETIWYNSSSWYVYISLDNWIIICEAFNWVEFLVTNFEDWEEFFYGTYEETLEKLNSWF